MQWKKRNFTTFVWHKALAILLWHRILIYTTSIRNSSVQTSPTSMKKSFMKEHFCCQILVCLSLQSVYCYLQTHVCQLHYIILKVVKCEKNRFFKEFILMDHSLFHVCSVKLKTGYNYLQIPSLMWHCLFTPFILSYLTWLQFAMCSWYTCFSIVTQTCNLLLLIAMFPHNLPLKYN